VLVLGICAVLLRSGTTRRPLWLLLASASATLVGDLVLAYRVVHVDAGQLHTSAALDSQLLLPVFLISLAAVEQCWQARHPDAATRGGRARGTPTWLPYLALAVGCLLLVAAACGAGLYPWGGLVLGTVVMTASVAVRQMIAIRENHELVLTDSLTGLPNRVRMRDELRRVLERARPGGDQAAVLLIDLDGFKKVNDTHGHEVGDAVLVAFAEVLRSALRHGDTPVRLGGDEFAVILEGIPSADTAIAVAERILAGAAEPRSVGGVHTRILASVGIAVTGGAEEPGTWDPRALLRHADRAMYAAKRRGTHSWQLHDPSVEVENNRRARDELLDALNHGQLRVFYQPIVSLVTGELVAVEALVRWQHPIRGLLTPAQFLPTAERLGIMQDLDSWVLDRACREILGLGRGRDGGRGLRLSVNVAPQHLQQPDVADRVLAVLARTGFAPRLLVLEITEGQTLQEETTIRSLQLLRGHGVQIALDDFGTGYSSLGRLGQLPIDILKLDRCFVTELQTDPTASVVVQTVLRLSQLLQLETVAEGITRPAQVEQFAQAGFTTAQGYHFARPMDVVALRSLLDDGTSFPVPTDLRAPL
jgi:diguanylate cyclase (GGDEF)-like protein